MENEKKQRFSKFKSIRDSLFNNEEIDEDYPEYENENEESAGGSYGDDDLKDIFNENSSSSKPSFKFDDVSSSSTRSSSTSNAGGSSATGYGYSSGSSRSSSYSPRSSSRSNVYSMNNQPKIKLALLKLEKIEDAVRVADEILNKDTIILFDLSAVSPELKRRIIDFIDGVRYTCGAKIKTVADYTYLVVPEYIELTGDLFKKINNGEI